MSPSKQDKALQETGDAAEGEIDSRPMLMVGEKRGAAEKEGHQLARGWPDQTNEIEEEEVGNKVGGT
jgi:fructose-1,6-bisphosphatase/sedoheptulose 1,7-bisphosphatase-like protein